MTKTVYITAKGVAWLVILGITTGCLGCLGYYFFPLSIDYVEHSSASPSADEDFQDDQLADIKRPPFDPGLVDSRPLKDYNNWQINDSAAVLRLDVPPIKPDEEKTLLTLHPSYRAALDSPHPDVPVLPSVNLLDGKAKQFDDGLYAALDQAYYRGLNEHLVSHVALVRRLYNQVDKKGPAAAFLAAGLELADVRVDGADQAEKALWLNKFQADELRSKPIGFYTWNSILASCFRFLRFFQQQFSKEDLAVPSALAKALRRDPALLSDYRKAVNFYSRMTNPPQCHSVADIAGSQHLNRDGLEQQPSHDTVALFPPSTSREAELFERLFRNYLPPNVDLMRKLVKRIRSGEVDLTPRPNSGWYDQQVYALETLLLPGKGQEKDKLMLTRAYKKRLVEAFKALITKRLETHARQLEPIPLGCSSASPTPPPITRVIRPRLASNRIPPFSCAQRGLTSSS